MTDVSIMDTAAQWHEQVTAETVDWDAFTLWLEADPGHARAYDAVALVDALIAERAPALAGLTAANDDPAGNDNGVPMRTPSRRWAGAALAGLAAVAAALVLAFLPVWPGHGEWQTGDGAQTVALADGTRIVLAPHSRLTRAGDRLALAGGAVFAVPHRPDRTLTISAGELTISDIGTHFDLRNDDGIVRLSLDEGQVSVSSTRMAKPVTVAAGQALLFDPADAQISLGAGSTGDWQHDQLSYRDAPLPLVVADIARYGPVPLRADGALAHLHFSGTLRLGTGHDPAADLARLMALDVGMSGRGAVLRAHGQGRGAASRSTGAPPIHPAPIAPTPGTPTN